MASNAYDWREQRVAASSTEIGARHYLYAEDGQLLAEHDAATGALIREYVWLDTMPLAMVSGAISTPTYTWITTGNLNEPLLLTNAAGAVTASTTRDPWGNPILLAGGQPLDLGYPGQWRDPATGLFQNWHRDYDPTLGRYAQADPLGLGGGSNLFAYVGGDPVNMVDPEGLRTYWEHYTGLPDSYRQDAINSIAGWSDSYTFGGTYYLRELLGANNDVRVCDPWYLGGSLVGLISPRGAARTVTRWFRTGKEFSVGPVRIAPFGNRNPNWNVPPHPTGRFPHYHAPGPKRPDGSRAPGHSPGRHRPWDKSPSDKSWKDRFWPW